MELACCIYLRNVSFHTSRRCLNHHFLGRLVSRSFWADSKGSLFVRIKVQWWHFCHPFIIKIYRYKLLRLTSIIDQQTLKDLIKVLFILYGYLILMYLPSSKNL